HGVACKCGLQHVDAVAPLHAEVAHHEVEPALAQQRDGALGVRLGGELDVEPLEVSQETHEELADLRKVVHHQDLPGSPLRRVLGRPGHRRARAPLRYLHLTSFRIPSEEPTASRPAIESAVAAAWYHVRGSPRRRAASPTPKRPLVAKRTVVRVAPTRPSAT